MGDQPDRTTDLTTSDRDPADRGVSPGAVATGGELFLRYECMFRPGKSVGVPSRHQIWSHGGHRNWHRPASPPGLPGPPGPPAHVCRPPRTAKKPPAERGASSEKSRRRPTLPGGYPPSTIGADRLNCRVRNGNGCISVAMATGNHAPPSRGTRPRKVDLKARCDPMRVTLSVP